MDGTHRKVLGMTWDIQTDNIIFDFTNIIGLCDTLEPTKRNILPIQGMFYDPTGLSDCNGTRTQNDLVRL